MCIQCTLIWARFVESLPDQISVHIAKRLNSGDPLSYVSYVLMPAKHNAKFDGLDMLVYHSVIYMNGSKSTKYYIFSSYYNGRDRSAVHVQAISS